MLTSLNVCCQKPDRGVDVMRVCMTSPPVWTYSSRACSGSSFLPLIPGETRCGGRMGANTCSASLVGGLAPPQKEKKKGRLCIWQMAKLRQAHRRGERKVPEVVWICLQNKSFWPTVWRHYFCCTCCKCVDHSGSKSNTAHMKTKVNSFILIF